MASDHIRLGDQATLTKIDKLRELNIGTETPLPQVRPEEPRSIIVFFLTLLQILVVGDQSLCHTNYLLPRWPKERTYFHHPCPKYRLIN